MRGGVQLGHDAQVVGHACSQAMCKMRTRLRNGDSHPALIGRSQARSMTALRERSSSLQAPGRRAFGGTAGNELITLGTASILTVLLAAEGVTLLDLHGLRTPHMVLGLVLIPPLMVKLASTGYRMVRYYTGARAYREKG